MESAVQLVSRAPVSVLGANLNQALGHQDEPENLRPLRNDVADDLSPPAAQVHRPECHHPGDARDHKKQGERVLTLEFRCRRPYFALRLLAFGGALFVQVLGHDNGYQDSRPVRDGVPKE